MLNISGAGLVLRVVEWGVPISSKVRHKGYCNTGFVDYRHTSSGGSHNTWWNQGKFYFLSPSHPIQKALPSVSLKSKTLRSFHESFAVFVLTSNQKLKEATLHLCVQQSWAWGQSTWSEQERPVDWGIQKRKFMWSMWDVQNVKGFRVLWAEWGLMLVRLSQQFRWDVMSTWPEQWQWEAKRIKKERCIWERLKGPGWLIQFWWWRERSLWSGMWRGSRVWG